MFITAFANERIRTQAMPAGGLLSVQAIQCNCASAVNLKFLSFRREFWRRPSKSATANEAAAARGAGAGPSQTNV
jgi:hypothetical protein